MHFYNFNQYVDYFNSLLILIIRNESIFYDNTKENADVSCL